MKQALDLIFPKNLIKEPVICKMSKECPVTFNIRRAKVTENTGEIILELEGSESAIENALKWLRSHGVKVDPITHDTFES